MRLEEGYTLLLYTDGLSESQNVLGEEYGRERLSRLAAECLARTAGDLVKTCVRELSAFRSDAPVTDDLTVLALRRAE